MNESTSARINIARIVMIVGIVILHVPPYVPLNEVSGLFESIKAFFAHGVFRSSVPVLSAISGYLIIRTIDTKSYGKLVTSKIRTLLIPMVTWNLPLLLLMFFIQLRAGNNAGFSFIAYPFDIMRWLDGLISLKGLPVNYPLNFLRDVFVLALLSPCFYFLLKRFSYTGLVSISLFFWFDFDGDLVIRNQMAINFCCGAIAALKSWDLTKLDRYRLHCLVALVCFSVLIVLVPIENRSYFRVVAPFLIWPLLSYFEHGKFRDFLVHHSKMSFFIFCAHAPLLIAIDLTYKKVFYIYIPYPLFWALAPVITVFICYWLYVCGFKYIPNQMKFALGGR